MAGMPDWVARHKAKGVEIRLQRGRWYAYRVRTHWDKESKRPRKVTEAYLGSITKEGLIPPRHKRLVRLEGRLDAGNIALILPFTRPLEEALKASFPDDWQDLIAAAVLKLCYLEPCSRLRLRYETSWAKKRWPHAALGDRDLPDLLRRTGFQWAAQRDVFRTLAADEKHMAIDLSHVFSWSDNIPWLEYGHNGDDAARPQLQVLLAWGTATHRPGFLQLLLGATNSSQTLAHAVKEAPIQGLVGVMDKGFWSPANVATLEDAGVHYVIALRRDLPIVDLKPHSRYRGHFQYRERTQWWRRDAWDGRTIYHFLDKTIADHEESAYFNRVQEAKTPAEKRRIDASRREHHNGFGTLSVLTDTGATPEEAYDLIKQRREVEEAYDGLQNELRADVTWMRSKEGMAGYFFIAFLALHVYAQILDHLKRKKMLSTWSVRDVLTYLSKVDVVEEDGDIHVLPVTAQTQTVIDRLELPITEILRL